MDCAANHLSATTGGESAFVRQMWRTSVNSPPRLAGNLTALRAGSGTQRALRATRVLQIRFVRHTCRTMGREDVGAGARTDRTYPTDPADLAGRRGA